ncbi:MAG: NHL repeat-containing protein [Thermoanaerobaculia bacterium]
MGFCASRSAAAIAACVIAAAPGCSTAPSAAPGESLARIVFPPAPAPPVIEWLASYAKASDAGAGQGSVTKFLVGKDEMEPALIAPTSVAIAPDGAFFVVDQRLDGIVIIDPARKRFELFRGDGPGALGQPVGVAIGPDGTVYVSDGPAQAVYSYDTSLRFKSAYGGPKAFTKPTSVAVSADGKRLAVCDTQANHVYVLSTADGAVLKRLGAEGGGDRPGDFRKPYSAAFDEEGYLYVSDYLNFRIQAFDPEGTFDMTWGQAGNRPGDLNRPRGLNADFKRGVIFEVDGAFQLVQMFNADGELLMWFGGPGAGPAQFSLPAGIDRRGDIIAVADTLNRRIQVFRFLGAPKAP